MDPSERQRPDRSHPSVSRPGTMGVTGSRDTAGVLAALRLPTTRERRALPIAFVGATVWWAVAVGGCFPKLPPLTDDAEVAPDGGSADGGDGRVPALETSDGEMADGAIEDAEETALASTDIPSENDVIDVGPDVPTTPTCEGDGDCSARDTSCASFTCVEGQCVAQHADTDTPCDDNDKCTDNDRCAEGVCVGTPRVCVASSPCVVAAGCFPGTGTCIETPVTAPTSCDDGDRCTTNDMCTNGRCVGGPSPIGSDDLAVALTSNNDGHVFWGVAEHVTGAMTALVQFGDQGTFSSTTSVELPAGPSPRLGFLELDEGGRAISARRWATPLDEADAGPLSAELGMRAIASGGLTFGGLFNGAFVAFGAEEVSGAPVSEVGTEADGLFVARVDATRRQVWTVTVHGIVDSTASPASGSFVGGLGRDRWMPAADGAGVLALNVRDNAGLVAVRDAAQRTSTIDATGSRYGAAALLWRIGSDGSVAPLGRVTSATGEVVISEGVALVDGSVVLGGVARGGGAAVTTDAGTIAIPSSANDAVYAWIALVDGAGTVRWTRSFRNAAQTGGDSTLDVKLAAMGGDSERVAIAIRAHRNPLFGGVGAPTAAVLTGITAAQPLEQQWIVATIGTAGGTLVDATQLSGEAMVVSGVGIDADGPVVAGNAASVSLGGTATLARVGGPPRPFVARPDRWARWVVWQTGNDSGGNVPAPSAVPFWDDGGAPVALARSAGSAWLASRLQGETPFEVGPDRSASPAATYTQGLAIVRLNSRDSLDCE